jgi:chemotaxis response regulator CheB
MRALVIEDEALLAWMIEEILLEQGIAAVDLAWSETQAIAAAGRNCPHVLIADSHINNGNAVSAVRSICAGTDIPVIFVTVDAVSMGGALPPAYVVEKPFVAQTLIDALKGCVLQA